MNDKEEKQFWQAVAQGASEAVCAIACELRELRTFLEQSKSHTNLATKSDLREMEDRLTLKIETVLSDDATLERLTAKLRKANDSLAAAVAADKPNADAGTAGGT